MVDGLLWSELARGGEMVAKRINNGFVGRKPIHGFFAHDDVVAANLENTPCARYKRGH